MFKRILRIGGDSSVPVCTPNRGVYKETDKQCGRVSGCVDVCMCIRKTFYVSFSCQSPR